MRRLAFAAVCGTLLLAACSDQSRSPTEPPDAPAPQADFGSCKPVRFPIVNVSGLIVQVFPKGTLRTQALLQAAAVALLWDTCHPAAARKVAVYFVTWIDLHAPSTAPASKVLELKLAILNGVGIPTGTPAGSPGDFGVGTFDPNNTNKTLIKTTSGTALIELEPGSFNELTTIVVSRNPDAANLTNFDGRQFAPNFDYNAINASGNHVLNAGHPAIIAFCLLNSDFVTYPANRGIGHNPVAGAPGFPFEILDPVDLGVEGRSDLAAALNCGNLAPTTIIIGGFGQGLPGIANAAWRTARQYLAPVARAVFLPEALHAVTLGTLPPPIGGKAPSLSPFKVVEPATITPSAGDGQSAPAGSAVPIPPAVVVRNASTEAPVPGVSVTFAVASGGGSITGPTAVTNASGVAAVGSWTLGTTPGTNTLSATAQGLTGSPVVFTATGVQPLPATFGSGGWSYKQISNSDAVPSTWTTITPTAADGWVTGSAPFGSSDVSGCGGLAFSTPWGVGTTMLLRRDVFIPANTAMATIDVLIDNDVFVFVNGDAVNSQLFHHEGCANFSPLPGFTVQASPTGPLLPGQVNKIFIRGVDLGVQAYLDAKITLIPVTP